MNRQYTYIDGKIIISSDKGLQKVIDNSDNIEEILKQENLVEVLKEEIADLEDIKDDIYCSKEKILKPFIHWFLYPLVWTIIIIICKLEMLISIKTLLMFDFIFLLPTGVVFSVQNKIKYSKDNKNSKNIDNLLLSLKNELTKEKEQLLELKKFNSNIKEIKNTKTVFVDDEKIFVTLKKIYDKLELADLKKIKDILVKETLLYGMNDSNYLLEYLLEYLDNEKENHLVKKKILKR